MSGGHVIKEVWRGEHGILYLCHLECTCSWRSAEVADPALLRIPRALHLDGPWADVDLDSWAAEFDTLLDASTSDVDSWPTEPGTVPEASSTSDVDWSSDHASAARPAGDDGGVAA